MARAMFGKNIPDAAVVYVWDNRNPVGTARKSSYTDRSQLVVAETGSGRAGNWVAERADSDSCKASQQTRQAVQLAVASDGSIRRAKPGGLCRYPFVSRDQPCALSADVRVCTDGAYFIAQGFSLTISRIRLESALEEQAMTHSPRQLQPRRIGAVLRRLDRLAQTETTHRSMNGEQDVAGQGGQRSWTYAHTRRAHQISDQIVTHQFTAVRTPKTSTWPSVPPAGYRH
jgi:hypothetical protein